MTIGSRQTIRAIDDEIIIKINEREINRVDSGALKRIRPYITTSTAVQVYQALIQPHFDHCCSVWDGLGETLSCKIQKLQNRPERVIMRANYDDSAGILLDTLHWDNLSLRREKLKAGLMIKTLKKICLLTSKICFLLVALGTI